MFFEVQNSKTGWFIKLVLITTKNVLLISFQKESDNYRNINWNLSSIFQFPGNYDEEVNKIKY